MSAQRTDDLEDAADIIETPIDSSALNADHYTEEQLDQPYYLLTFM
jgi:hypothetical protein